MSHARVCRLAVLFVLVAAGCRGSDLIEISGTVTMGGQPLPGAKLTFHPVVDGKLGRGTLGYAVTDDEGRYVAMTGGGEGLEAGTYKVTVSTATAAPPTAESATPAGEANRVPPEYARADTTPLEVTADVEKEFDIAL